MAARRTTRFRSTLGLVGGLAILQALVVAPTHADSLYCEPLYGLSDFRLHPPDYVEKPPLTYYLFDNADLLHYSIHYMRRSPTPVDRPLGWPDNLEAEVAFDGVAVEAASIVLEPLRRRFSERRYFLDGEQLDHTPFEGRKRGRPPVPMFEYDRADDSEREVESFPDRFQPLDRAILDVALVDAAGRPLAPGLYTIRIRDTSTQLACDEHLMVLRRPETQLDRTDAWIVRHRYHEARGESEAATDALRRATEVSPDCLKAWYYRLTDAHRHADLEAWDLAISNLERILVGRGGHVMAVSATIQRFAGDALRRRDETRADVALRAAARASGGAS